MKTEDYINQYIEKEKQIEPNPFLSTRIMAFIEKPTAQKINPLQTIIAVTSISLVMLLGFQLSSLYNSTSAENQLHINDSQIEMLHIYQTESNE